MNKQIKLTIGIGLTVLLLAAVFATAAFAQGPGGNFGGGMMGGRSSGGMMDNGQGMMGGRGFSGMMGNGQGMMGGQGFGGMMGNGQGMMSGIGTHGWGNSQPSAPLTGTVPYGGNCCGMMGTGMMRVPGVPATGQPISMDQAAAAVQQYVSAYNNSDLTLTEIMEFDNNFYALITEKSTGIGAFELLVDRFSSTVYPEPGPNMMWNTKYGHMGMGGGMMGGHWRQQTGPMTVTVAQARTIAQQWLDANQPGAKLADDEMQFYGHYTMDFLKDGKTSGMLSVNGYTGQVWFHTWHGNFISEKEF